MPINPYFNNYNSQTEQWVVEDLIVEAIQIMGFDAYYIPIANHEDQDIIYGEDPLKRFSGAYPVEMYLSEARDPGLEKDFFSKFGLQIQNTTRVLLSRRSFGYRVPQDRFNRPLEGDLVYIPFLKGTGELYEIKFVNITKDFYMLGRKYPFFYELELELFKYSQEQIDTGIPEIDVVAELDAYSIDFTMDTGSGNYTKKEIIYQGTDIANATATATVSSWDSPSKTLKVTNISGEFDPDEATKGVQSNATFTLASYDPLQHQYRNPFDNKELEEEGDLFVNRSESNPFGLL